MPLICLGYGAVVVMVVGAFWKSHAGLVALTIASLAGALLTTGQALVLAPRQVTPLLRVDVLTLSYLMLFVLGAMALVAFSWDYLASTPRGCERFYSLLLLAVTGMGVLAASNHFASFFLGLEILSVSLYGLIGFTLRRPASLEGSVKYLVLAGVSLSFLLMGIALMYYQSGTLEFTSVGAHGNAPYGSMPLLTLLGLGLIIVGFGFKLAWVPFHTWAPDVYQGAPAPVSALIAIGSKAAVLVVLLRFVVGQELAVGQGLAPAMSVATGMSLLRMPLELLAVITMFGGNLLALFQTNIKRLLAYSSIAQMGYLLIPLLAGGADGIASIWFYFVSYFITTIGAFGVISALSNGGEEPMELESYRGMGFRRPWIGAVLALMVLSLAGIPLTVGFMAKLYIFSAAARSGLWVLLVVGVVNSGMAAYYYLRVIGVIYSHTEELSDANTSLGSAGFSLHTPARIRPASAVVLIILSVLMIALGVFPGALMARAQAISRDWLSAPAAASSQLSTSLIPQRFYRIQLSGFSRRVDAEEQPDRSRHRD